MPSIQHNTPLQGGSIAPGQSHSLSSLGLAHNGVAVVTPIPNTLEGILAIENLRVARKTGPDGDPVQFLFYNVKNVGNATVQSYTVNVTILFS
jgi:hypothetical protein